MTYTEILDDNASYKRLGTVTEWCCTIGFFLTIWVGVGLVFLVALLILTFTSRSILVRDINTKEKIQTSRDEWNRYCDVHGMNFWNEYTNLQRHIVKGNSNIQSNMTNINSTDTKFCTKCGSKMRKDAVYCPVCGTKQGK